MNDVTEEVPEPAALLRRMAVGLVGLIALAAVAALVLRAPIEAAATPFVETWGLLGIFTGVVLLDSLPFTIHEPLLLLGFAGGLGFGPIFLVAASGSVTAGFVGYTAGRLVGRTAPVQRLLARWQLAAFFRRYGVLALAVAAITPFPFAIATWGAGAAGVSIRVLALGALFRVPKVLLYLSGITAAWRLGLLVPPP